MNELQLALHQAWQLVTQFDLGLMEIVLLSLSVSSLAVLLAGLVGVFLGAFLAINRFPGRQWVVAISHALMGLPPVVVGLALYLLLSRSGPLGVLGWLFTAKAMVFAQFIIVLPIIVSLAHHQLADAWRLYGEQLRSFGAKKHQVVRTLVWDTRWQLLTGVLVGLGRALGEVGAVMIVGGNIDHVTRIMTTSIALEVNRGNLSLALALGFVLLGVSIAINLLVAWVKHRNQGALL